MADYIEREVVDKVIDTARKMYLNDYGAVEVVQQIKSKMCNMPNADKQPVDRWISVKDKLHEVGKVVIVCDKQGGVGAMELLSNGQWYHRGMAWSAEWILYWQSLPEPPKPIKG